MLDWRSEVWGSCGKREELGVWRRVPGEKIGGGSRARASRSQRFPGVLWPDPSAVMRWAGPGRRILAGNLKLLLGYLLVPESPRGNGYWDDASILQSDHNYSFTVFAVSWEDR